MADRTLAHDLSISSTARFVVMVHEPMDAVAA